MASRPNPARPPLGAGQSIGGQSIGRQSSGGQSSAAPPAGGQPEPPRYLPGGRPVPPVPPMAPVGQSTGSVSVRPAPGHPTSGGPTRATGPASAVGPAPMTRPGYPALPVSPRAFGLPNLRRNVCPHFYMTGTRGALPIQAPHLLKALIRQDTNVSRCQLRGGVHLEQEYVNDVCLTARFNQCVFYEDELTGD